MPEDRDTEQESLAYIENLLQETGVELGPKPDRVSEQYADERIREKIDRFDTERQRAGLWSINRVLKERDVPPSLRLHLVTAVTHLSRISQDSLEERRGRSQE